MKRTLALFLFVALLLITAQRLPAPISEVPQTTQAPKPKREPASKPKPKSETIPKSPLKLSFPGTWTGTTITKSSNGGDSGPTNYIIRISDDEKTVWINWDLQQPSGPGHQASSNRFRETLGWSLTLAGSDLNVIDEEMSNYTVTDTLRMNANGTASFVREGRYPSMVNFWGGHDPGITFKCAGTLSRQDASPAPAIPQTITTSSAPKPTAPAVAAQTAGIPTATPVPNKPGFVYNPFDPTRKRILDVRGIASGTKVTIPATGKQFIVP